METPTHKIEIVVESDYDNYFLTKVNHWVSTKIRCGEKFHHQKIVISAGPYRPYAVGTASKDGVLSIDFYSALRVGFGELQLSEVLKIIDMI